MINARGWIVILFVAILCLAASRSHAGGSIVPRHQRPGRVNCIVIRDFVAMVGKDEAEKLARDAGASDARVAAAKECLKG
jgi:hypothetical protein